MEKLDERYCVTAFRNRGQEDNEVEVITVVPGDSLADVIQNCHDFFGLTASDILIADLIDPDSSVDSRDTLDADAVAYQISLRTDVVDAVTIWNNASDDQKRPYLEGEKYHFNAEAADAFLGEVVGIERMFQYPWQQMVGN